MSFTLRLVVLICFAATLYALWPRNPSLLTFDPSVVAQLETQTWKNSNATRSINCVASFYKLYDFQYGFAPLTAIALAQNSARALHLFRGAPDAMDQEKALPYLLSNLATIKSATKSNFDESLASQQFWSVWTQSAESASPEILAKSVANFWATLYGKPASIFAPAANAYAEALLAGGFARDRPADWKRVETSLAQAYQHLATALK